MKKILCFLITAVVSTLIGCGQTLNNASGDGTDGDGLTATSTKFKYLDHLYNKESAEKLYEELLSGDVYERYPDEVKEKLNVYLQFPLQSLDSGDAVTKSLPGTRSVTDSEWWDSLPQEFLDYCKEQGIDIIAEGLSEALVRFLDSEEGQAYVSAYLDEAEARLENIVNYAVDQFSDEYEDEIALLLAEGGLVALSQAAMAGATVYAAATMAVSITINPLTSILTAASMVQSHYQHQQMMAQLYRIELLLEQIQATLDRIEEKIDLILGYTIDIAVAQKYENAKKAREQLRIIEQQLVYLQNLNDEDEKQLIRNYISEANIADDSYQVMMERAFNSAVETQKWLFDEGYAGETDIDVNIKILIGPSGIGNFQEDDYNTITLNLPMLNPTNHIFADSKYFNYNDILLMIKLSQFRLKLAEIVYDSDDLIKYRKRIAESDLNNYFNSINLSIDNSLNNIQNHSDDIASIHDQIISYNTGKRMAIIYVVLFDNTPIIVGGGFEYNGEFLIPRDSVNIFQEYMNLDLSSCQLANNVDEFEDKLEETLLSAFYQNTSCTEQITQLKALVTSWMMTLQAHIAAGEGV